jgi:BirA family biotin operon repressor/biotin-[acetyl-CoA-carboxylase] ligase
MSVKESIRTLLEEHRGEFLSGGEMAEQLGVSRNAVWKAIRQLETEGYRFDSVSGRGYRLREESNVLSPQGVARYLGERRDLFQVRVMDEVTSTNTVLKEMAGEGASEFTVLAANRQTAGRGRMNRAFYSPAETGLYFSVLLRPKLSAREALFLTTAAAVAVAEAVDALSGREAGIKWVNDVFLDGKKICGILTEASLDMESGGMECAICGIGVNLCDPPEGFPTELRDTVGSVFGTQPPPADVRCRMAGEILTRLAAYYEGLAERAFFDEYTRRSVVIGREVLLMDILGIQPPRPATALAIDRDCHLHVRYEDGTQAVLSSGEIRVRLV